MGMMVDGMNQKIVVKGHGTKGRWHKVEFKALEDPIVLEDVGWKIFPQLSSYTLCLQYVQWCHIGNKWPFSKHETNRKKIPPNIQVVWMNISRHAYYRCTWP
jgi:hypothetical protein